MKRLTFLALLLVAILPLRVFAAADKPNILLIMSDDVGITNISAYREGLVGYKTPLSTAFPPYPYKAFRPQQNGPVSPRLSSL